MDFWYESSQEQLILLAVSHTSCTTGSSCTITTFSALLSSDLVVTIVRITVTRCAGGCWYPRAVSSVPQPWVGMVKL